MSYALVLIIFILLLIYIVVSLLVLVYPQLMFSRRNFNNIHQLKENDILIFAHRGGLMECPENTFESLEYVLSLNGVNMETDI